MSRKTFLLQSSRNDKNLDRDTKELFKRIKEVPPSAWEKKGSGNPYWSYIAPLGDDLVEANLENTKSESNSETTVSRLTVYYAERNFKVKTNIWIRNLKLTFKTSDFQIHDLINELSNLIVLDHDDLDAIGGFIPRTRKTNVNDRVSHAVLTAFYAGVPKTERRSDAPFLRAWHNRDLENREWEYSVYHGLNVPSFKMKVDPQLSAQIPRLMRLESQGLEIIPHRDIINIGHQKPIKANASCDVLQSMEAIATLKKLRDHFGDES